MIDKRCRLDYKKASKPLPGRRTRLSSGLVRRKDRKVKNVKKWHR